MVIASLTETVVLNQNSTCFSNITYSSSCQLLPSVSPFQVIQVTETQTGLFLTKLLWFHLWNALHGRAVLSPSSSPPLGFLISSPCQSQDGPLFPAQWHRLLVVTPWNVDLLGLSWGHILFRRVSSSLFNPLPKATPLHKLTLWIRFQRIHFGGTQTFYPQQTPASVFISDGFSTFHSLFFILWFYFL